MTDYPTANQYAGRLRTLRLIVLHSTETPTNTARSVARNFQDTTRKASAHWIVGTDATVSGVAEADTAWAAPGANADGIQIEQCGYAASTDWRRGEGLRVVQATAHLLAQVCARHNIPLRHLSNAELAAGASGVVSHAQVSAVYKKSTHTDPGPTYPWDLVLQEDDMQLTDRLTRPDGHTATVAQVLGYVDQRIETMATQIDELQKVCRSLADVIYRGGVPVKDAQGKDTTRKTDVRTEVAWNAANVASLKNTEK